jgi:hypothetical protein
MDFIRIGTKQTKDTLQTEVSFTTHPAPKDLMIRGGRFYAVWDEEVGFWTTNEYRLYELVDRLIREYSNDTGASPRYMSDYNSKVLTTFRNYCHDMPDVYSPLDSSLTFANTRTKRDDYASKHLPYSLAEGAIDAWDELVGTLYSPPERQKIEWAIGAIVSGDSRNLQKFITLVGDPGTGKSTILNVIENLFSSYVAMFDAKALGSSSSSFSTEAFKANPLVAIQHDGDLSRIEDNSRLNSIVSHDVILINEKYKSSYPMRLNSFLFMGTNRPVKITEARSGLLRRLIDVHPKGIQIPSDRYWTLLHRIEFEYGAIAHHCLTIYERMGPNFYNKYRPMQMMYATNFFINFVIDYYDELNSPEGITTKRAYSLYKTFASENGAKTDMPRHIFQSELGAYFEEFHDRIRLDGKDYRGLFRGFKADKVYNPNNEVEETESYLNLKKQPSLLDEMFERFPAQLANQDGLPSQKWQNVTTTLSDLNTKKLHYVQVPEQHIVIDFDIKNEAGEKDQALNLAAAEAWPETYAELSQGGNGLHLHYIYEGDVKELASEYAPGIEVKTLLGNASLRRRLSKCNDKPVATLTSGLPLKERKMISEKVMKSEKTLRDLIGRNLRKEIHPGTKSSIDFIKKILDEAYESEMQYDVSDLKPKVFAFANNSTNQALYCLKAVQQMKFASEERANPTDSGKDDRLVHYDVEVFPNLFAICWKFDGSDEVVRMVNPTPEEVGELLGLRLIGFNNRRYDNHIIYARYLGYSNEQLFRLSDRIINSTGARSNAGLFGEAYGISYTDIYDFASKKQGLKKWQIELGLHHQELDIPWDEPVPEELWERVLDYCENDVRTQEAVFHARHEDFVARQILAELSGLSVNDTTQKHTAKIIFGDDRQPQASFIYTDLSEMFPGYEFDMGRSTYRGEDPSEGGYVYAEPGIYENVAVLDVASMHPTSIINLNLFGPYTRNFEDLVRARLAIKAHEYATARKLLDGKLAKYVDDSNDSADALAYALKIVINIVYGLTSAKFDNPFRDNRNKDNIVAKRGALFMIDLKHFVRDRGWNVIHIKTDSIKVSDPTPELIQDIIDFGAKYGYSFEHEVTYDKFCLVNDAVYIARKGDKWDAVGAQFQHPYVFKTLFSKEPVTLEDLAETKSVQKGTIYLERDDQMHFIGRTAQFFPVTEEAHGGTLYRVNDDKRYAVAGTKGYLWLEANQVRAFEDQWMHLDMSYYTKLVEEAIKSIEKFGPVEEFIS